MSEPRSTVERVIDPTRQGIAADWRAPDGYRPVSPPCACPKRWSDPEGRIWCCGDDLRAAKAESAPDLIGQAKPVSLEEAIAMVDGWTPGFAPFALHQVARALREEIAGLQADADNDGAHVQSLKQAISEICEVVGFPRGDAQWPEWIAALRTRQEEDAARLGNLRRENDELRRELTDLQRTFDLRWDADMRGIKRWQAAHPGNDLVWPDRADMVVWLLERDDQAVGAETERWTDRIWRACEAIPCSAGLGDCHAPYYRYQPCCNLRVALWPGEEFPTDYLPDEGMIHLFEPGRGEKPRASAGCVRLVEPLLPEDQDWLEE